MKAFQVTCLVLIISALSAQEFRHVYYKCFEIRTSVLDKFDKKDLTRQIESSGSIDELLAKYAPARKITDDLDEQMEKEARGLPADQRNTFRREFRRDHESEYDIAAELRAAITTWQAQSHEIRDLRIFWFFGLGLALLGPLLYFLSPWLGVSFIVAGALEMIWWTSPSFTWGGTVREYERLLNNRLLFTTITFALVLLLWFISAPTRRKCQRANTGASPPAQLPS